MIDYLIRPSGPLTGEVRIPGDKSISHRAAILGAVANGTTRILDPLLSEDVIATLRAVESMGVAVSGIESGDSVTIAGSGLRGLNPPQGPIDCGNSGTAMRLLAGLLAGQPFASELIGDESLTRRPMKRVVEPLRAMGANIDATGAGTAPLAIGAASGLAPIQWTMQVPSAQVKSAILLAGLYARGSTEVTERTRTRDHTERMLDSFGAGIEVDSADGVIRLEGGDSLSGTDIVIPGDISSAAFFIAAGLIVPGSRLGIAGIGVNELRFGMIGVVDAMGAASALSAENSRRYGAEPVADFRVSHCPALRGCDIPAMLVPTMVDEVPMLAVLAAFAEGETRFSGCEELRVKESDRINSVVQGLRQLGVNVMETKDGMIIQGGRVGGGEVDSFGDHRVAMAFAVAGSAAASEVRVRDCGCVATSFPDFVELARGVGMDIEQLET